MPDFLLTFFPKLIAAEMAAAGLICYAARQWLPGSYWLTAALLTILVILMTKGGN